MTEGEWAEILPLLEQALEHGGGFHTADDVLMALAAEEAFLFTSANSIMVAEFWTMPRAKVVNVWLAAGDLGEIVDELQPRVEDWARAAGCAKAVICGRPGWKKPLKASGFTPMYQAMVRDL